MAESRSRSDPVSCHAASASRHRPTIASRSFRCCCDRVIGEFYGMQERLSPKGLARLAEIHQIDGANRCVDQDHVPRVSLRSFAPEIDPSHVPARLLTNASTSARHIRRFTGCKVTDPSECFSTLTSGRRGRYRPSAYRPFSSLLSVAVMDAIRWCGHPTVKGKPSGFGMPGADAERSIFCAPHRAFVGAS